MKLELKHLAPYLPFKLNCLNQNLPDTEMVVEELIGISNHITWSGVFNAKYGSNHVPICGIKPILRPLSDLTNEFKDDFRFTERAMTIHKYGLNHWLKGLRFDIVEFLFENHYDVFGLIEKGLGIDVNTL